MTYLFKYISKVLLCCLGAVAVGCSSGPLHEDPDSGNARNPKVTLGLNVSVADTYRLSGTRAANDSEDNEFETEDALNVYEKINTLRVIIVREDNTVEHNRLISLPVTEGVLTLNELEFGVATDRGRRTEENGKIKLTERKRIYLIANEASIEPDLSSTFVALYPPPSTGKNDVQASGATLLPSTAASWLIWKEWPMGANAEEAVPYIDNEVSLDRDKKFIPMTEFFDVDVSSYPEAGGDQETKVENLFLTRNLVKFQFGFMSGQNEAFKITSIRFEKLMQKEFLFPNDMVYNPVKEDVAHEREIVAFKTPGSDVDNQLRKFVFTPEAFGTVPDGFITEYKGSEENKEAINGWTKSYNPLLYFCESNNNEGLGGKSIYKVSITAEIYQDDGQVLTEEFEAKTVESLLYSLPRNTIVRLNFGLKENHTLDCTVTVLPYTGVWLFPQFGIDRD